jgi:hypothetical protein
MALATWIATGLLSAQDLIRSHRGDLLADDFGWAVALIGDADRDGHAD